MLHGYSLKRVYFIKLHDPLISIQVSSGITLEMKFKLPFEQHAGTTYVATKTWSVSAVSNVNLLDVFNTAWRRRSRKRSLIHERTRVVISPASGPDSHARENQACETRVVYIRIETLVP